MSETKFPSGYIAVSNSIVIEFDFRRNGYAILDTIKSQFSGRQFDDKLKRWVAPITCDNAIAAISLAEKFNMTISNRDILTDYIKRYSHSLNTSYAMEYDLTIDGLGGELRPYQKVAVEYMTQNKKCIVADDMGIGKSMEAIGAIKLANAFPALIVTLATAKLNWLDYLSFWLPGVKSAIVKKPEDINRDNQVLIINYESLNKYLGYFMEIGIRAVVFDESHLIKNSKAKRTQASMHFGKFCEYVWLLTGTPMLNKPAELITQLELIGVFEKLGGWYNFATKYCGAYRDKIWIKRRNDQGVLVPTQITIWKFLPPKELNNLKELNLKLRGMGAYIRRNKREVLPELPDKQITHIFVDIDNREAYNKTLKDKTLKPMNKVGELYVLVGRGKEYAAVEWIKEFLTSEQKLVVFAYHKHFLATLRKAFPWAAHIMEEDSEKERRKQELEYQENKDCKLIICSLDVAGVAINLTAGSHVLMCELMWTYAELSQAEDRLNRSGQKNAVNVYYLLGRNTIDKDIIDKVEDKRRIMSESSDGFCGEEDIKDQVEQIYANKKYSVSKPKNDFTGRLF